METEIQYAIMKAAYAAWETGITQQVEGSNLIVIPDTALDAVAAELQRQGAQLEEAHMPKFWIEHEGRRARIDWLLYPPIQAPKE